MPSAWQASSCTITSRCRKAGRRMPTLALRGMAAIRRCLIRTQRLRRGMSRCRLGLAQRSFLGEKLGKVLCTLKQQHHADIMNVTDQMMQRQSTT